MNEELLIKQGENKIIWANQHMPVIKKIQYKFIKEKPLKDINIAMALHIEAKTAVLVNTLVLGGAKVSIAGCNPLSTQDDIVLALKKNKNISCFAKNNCSINEYYEYLNKVLDSSPNIIIDDGADLISLIHNSRTELLKDINGCCEETTTGVNRLVSMDKNKKLKLGVLAVNNAKTKYLFDNRYGTGQSVLNSIMTTTNMLIAGKKIVICGYGWCGKGIAKRASGLGGIIFITEVNSFCALEAIMDGFSVITMDEASYIGDIFITATGNINVINSSHFKNMKNGVILANAGHFNVEINILELESLSSSIKLIRNNIQEYCINNKKIYLIAEGRLVNLASGDGHPIEVMDLSFSNQALCSEYISSKKLESGVFNVPREIDESIASLKLESMNIKIDNLSDHQLSYLNNWSIGT